MESLEDSCAAATCNCKLVRDSCRNSAIRAAAESSASYRHEATITVTDTIALTNTKASYFFEKL